MCRGNQCRRPGLLQGMVRLGHRLAHRTWPAVDINPAVPVTGATLPRPLAGGARGRMRLIATVPTSSPALHANAAGTLRAARTHGLPPSVEEPPHWETLTTYCRDTAIERSRKYVSQ